MRKKTAAKTPSEFSFLARLKAVRGRHKNYQEAMQDALMFAESIVHTLRIPLVVLDRDLRVVFASQAFYSACRVEPREIKRKRLHEIGNKEWDIPELKERLNTVLRSEEGAVRLEITPAFPGTGDRTFIVNGRRLPMPADEDLILVDIEDISGRRMEQERLLAYERLVALGELSGNIAHEVRNPLATIDSSVFFLKRKLPDADEKVMVHLDRIKAGVDQANTIIQSLLDLSRMKEPRLAVLDLQCFIPQVVGSCGRPEGIDLDLSLPDEDLTIRGDPEQLRLAFHNILKNALEAMGGQGVLGVSASRLDDCAEITFSDTGHGFAAENAKRVFEPLYTTKASGMGFGLSIARSVFAKHNGAVECLSKVGGPTVVRVRLPLMAAVKSAAGA